MLLFLKTKDWYKAIQSCVRGQTAHIYPKDIKNIKIPMPARNDFEKMEDEIENIKMFLKNKSEANEKYVRSFNRLVSFMEAEDDQLLAN